MAERCCTTCGQSLSQCTCPVPDPPHTLQRVVAFQAAQDALLRYVGSTRGQANPIVRAHVQQERDRILHADETTIHRMAQALGVWTYRQRSRKLDPADISRRRPHVRQEFFDKHDRWPTLAEEAVLLGIGRKTLYRYLHPQEKNPRQA